MSATSSYFQTKTLIYSSGNAHESSRTTELFDSARRRRKLDRLGIGDGRISSRSAAGQNADFLQPTELFERNSFDHGYVIRYGRNDVVAAWAIRFFESISFHNIWTTGRETCLVLYDRILLLTDTIRWDFFFQNFSRINNFLEIFKVLLVNCPDLTLDGDVFERDSSYNILNIYESWLL